MTLFKVHKSANWPRIYSTKVGEPQTLRCCPAAAKHNTLRVLRDMDETRLGREGKKGVWGRFGMYGGLGLGWEDLGRNLEVFRGSGAELMWVVGWVGH